MQMQELEAGLRFLIRQIFDSFDLNRDGRLNPYEFGNLVTQVMEILTKKKLSQEEVDDLMFLADVNGDGYIGRHEYQTIRDTIIAEVGFLAQARPIYAQKLVLELHSLTTAW